MFLDIVAFTAFAETHAAEDVIAALNEYFEPIVHAIHEHNGDVDKFVGDQVFAIFHEPEEAVRAALAIRFIIEELAEQRRSRGVPAMEFRMGLNYGAVVRGNVGGDARGDNTLIGDVVNVAARLQSACEPGRILASESITEKMGSAAHLDRRLKYKLKGKEEHIVAAYISAREAVAI